jgi:uncharacterized protein YpiB (UPF0302 family)
LIVSNQANLTYQGVNYLMFTSTTTVNNATLVISNTGANALAFAFPAL